MQFSSLYRCLHDTFTYIIKFKPSTNEKTSKVGIKIFSQKYKAMMITAEELGQKSTNPLRNSLPRNTESKIMVIIIIIASI